MDKAAGEGRDAAKTADLKVSLGVRNLAILMDALGDAARSLRTVGKQMEEEPALKKEQQRWISAPYPEEQDQARKWYREMRELNARVQWAQEDGDLDLAARLDAKRQKIVQEITEQRPDASATYSPYFAPWSDVNIKAMAAAAIESDMAPPPPKSDEQATIDRDEIRRLWYAVYREWKHYPPDNSKLALETIRKGITTIRDIANEYERRVETAYKEVTGQAANATGYADQFSVLIGRLKRAERQAKEATERANDADRSVVVTYATLFPDVDANATMRPIAEMLAEIAEEVTWLRDNATIRRKPVEFEMNLVRERWPSPRPELSNGSSKKRKR